MKFEIVRINQPKGPITPERFKFKLSLWLIMQLREIFLKIYADIPLNLRKEIILILDKEPLTWNVAYVEVINNTAKSGQILKKLRELKII